MDFVENAEKTAEFLMNLRRMATAGVHDLVRIDHRGLCKLSPDAALMMTAELCYSMYLNPRLQFKVDFPVDKACKELLGEIGYYKYFLMPQWRGLSGQSRFYLSHQRGEEVNGELARATINHLRESADLPAQALYDALTEGMQNASEWGYAKRKEGYRSWWLLGYRDNVTKEVAYCFYDQGATIPTTIMTRKRDRFPLFTTKGSRLIQKAASKPYSSTRDEKRRGRGIPTLKRFVDDAGWGRLLIFSRESLYIHEKGKDDHLADFKKKLNGTLLSWTFRPPQKQ